MSSSNTSTPSYFTMSVKDYPKLHGQEDYRTWANAWEVAFSVLELCDIVNGTILKPEEQEETGGRSSITTTDKGKSTTTTELANWTVKCNRANSTYTQQSILPFTVMCQPVNPPTVYGKHSKTGLPNKPPLLT
jgi:hypothetical protein